MTLELVRPLRLKELTEVTGYSHTYIYAMRRGYRNDAGEFKKLDFTHGQRCLAQAVWDFVAQNPEFRLRKAAQSRQ